MTYQSGMIVAFGSAPVTFDVAAVVTAVAAVAAVVVVPCHRLFRP